MVSTEVKIDGEELLIMKESDIRIMAELVIKINLWSMKMAGKDVHWHRCAIACLAVLISSPMQ
jgi:hypothetical protein